MNNLAKFGDVVALLDDAPAMALISGQVGTIVESLNGTNFLVEFSDNRGRANVIAPFPSSQLLVLRGI